MPWNCYKVKSLRLAPWRALPSGGQIQEMLYELEDGTVHTIQTLPIGAMWHTSQEPEPDEDGPSICVLLPGRCIWHMNRPGSNGYLWNVAGEIPKVTATPSINFVGRYHGFVTDGVISDDCEGRKF